MKGKEVIPLAKKDVYVVPSDGRWAVKRPNADRASGVFDTQKEAIDRGRALAIKDKSELSIANREGQFREKNSYGSDPHPPKG